jgi:hypothetical protein
MAKLFNTNALHHFHQEIMITYITYSIANYYYMRYLTEKSKIPKLRTGNRKLRSGDYLSSQFHQVMQFSLFHRASNAPQTKKRQAFSVILT